MNITKHITHDRNDFVLVVIDMMRPVLRNERAHTSQTHKHIYIKRIKNASFTRERCIEEFIVDGAAWSGEGVGGGKGGFYYQSAVIKYTRKPSALFGGWVR